MTIEFFGKLCMTTQFNHFNSRALSLAAELMLWWCMIWMTLLLYSFLSPWWMLHKDTPDWLWPLFIREDVKRADGEREKKWTPTLIFQNCRFKCAPSWTPQWLFDSWIWLSYRRKSISGILVWKFKNLQVKIQESFQLLNSLDISNKHVDW